MVLLAMLVGNCLAADWQWSVAVESTVNGETDDHPRSIVSLIGLPGDISDQKLQALRPLVTSGRNGETLLAQQ